MTFDMLETGLHTLDFECCEDVETEPFRGVFSVQCMRDGNVYMTEQKKRQRNKPIFRDDNSSLSLGTTSCSLSTRNSWTSCRSNW